MTGWNKPNIPSGVELNRLRESSRKHSNRDESTTATPSPECPDAGYYVCLAAGTLDKIDRDKFDQSNLDNDHIDRSSKADVNFLLTHASTCELCAGRLKASLLALEGNPSPEELAAIAELAAAKAEWQRTLAHKLASTTARKQGGFSRPMYLAGAVAASLLVAVSIYAWQRRAHSPEQQLALAYNQSRSIELRIPDAQYSPLVTSNHVRGASEPQGNTALLEARAELSRRLQSSPQNPRALQLQARAEVLGEHYDSAVDIYDRLLAVGPVTPELLADSASAYFERGLVSNSELDRSTALDYLRRADQMAPTDPVVLFNEAIVMEDRGQLMNAVEVWNRFLTVERDSNWLAEGKRKLASLEQTLNRLKTHESRFTDMLATPEAMNALAANPKSLAAVDEEMTSMRLDQILPIGYPVQGFDGSQSQQARGSPCDAHCMAARKLLKALALSLEIKHRDFWLSDLLALDFDKLPSQTREIYFQAIQSLAIATRQDQTGIPSIGLELSEKSRKLFQQLDADVSQAPGVHRAAIVGEARSVTEELFALQRLGRHKECRVLSQQFRADSRFRAVIGRYPWIQSVSQLTESVCDDTPETRASGLASLHSSEDLADRARYTILKLRIQYLTVGDAQSTDDGETVEHVALLVLHQLYAADMPPYRIYNTIGLMSYIEQDSPRVYSAESTVREALAWNALTGNARGMAIFRMELAKAEIRTGAIRDAEKQLQLAYETAKAINQSTAARVDFIENDTNLASLMLERGDLSRAAAFLNGVEAYGKISDRWIKSRFNSARSMLDIAVGHSSEAATILEANVRDAEGSSRKSRESSVEYAQADHDLYAELAAAWLAQGRSPESILALWQRFRRRIHGLPITPCPHQTLDCEKTGLIAQQHQLGDSILTGQILLLDRILVYRMDRNQVSWSQRPFRRSEIVDAAHKLEQAVSSPYTSVETATALGGRLADALLPALPSSIDSDSALIIEPDPVLENLAWPVLPTAAGPLGIAYPIAEARVFSGYAATGLDTSARFSAGLDSRADSLVGTHSLIIGASITTSDQPPLPEALTEASQVSHELPSPTLLLGQHATTAKVASGLRSATSILFFCIALRTPRGTELLLAASYPGEKSPWIDGSFLHQFPPKHCRLAVLSACSTGIRDISWKHPMQDIVETLGSLGVQNVVATRWEVDSTASVSFMNAFYLNLSRKNSVPMALTLVRRLQFGQLQYHNPYYWGAYYVSSSDESYPRTAQLAQENLPLPAHKAS